MTNVTRTIVNVHGDNLGDSLDSLSSSIDSGAITIENTMDMENSSGLYVVEAMDVTVKIEKEIGAYAYSSHSLSPNS